MRTFSANIHEGHAVISSGSDLILVDTGSPVTIHSSGELTFMDERFTCLTSYGGLTIDGLSDLLGTRVTALMGMDILSQYSVLFDYKYGSISFDKDEMYSKGYQFPFTLFHGIPLIDIQVNDITAKCFLDSGAKLSYLDKALTDGLISNGREADFYPGLGRFTTEVYNIICSFEGAEMEVKFGNLPDNLKRLTQQANAQGILGFDLFNACLVLMDLPRNNIQIYYWG